MPQMTQTAPNGVATNLNPQFSVKLSPFYPYAEDDAEYIENHSRHNSSLC